MMQVIFLFKTFGFHYYEVLFSDIKLIQRPSTGKSNKNSSAL